MKRYVKNADTNVPSNKAKTRFGACRNMLSLAPRQGHEKNNNDRAKYVGNGALPVEDAATSLHFDD